MNQQQKFSNITFLVIKFSLPRIVCQLTTPNMAALLTDESIEESLNASPTNFMHPNSDPLEMTSVSFLFKKENF